MPLKIIISPAKKMKIQQDVLDAETNPLFLTQAGQLYSILRALSKTELQKLLRCNDEITALAVRRLTDEHPEVPRCAALFAYDGIQYQYMAPQVMDYGSLAYLTDHLRILSGLYGILRPLDGIIPYRLEMQAKLSANGGGSLYEFWGPRLANALTEECDTVIDLASQEYSKAVYPHLPSTVRSVTCTFGETVYGKIVEKGVRVKMARGEMVRYMAENRIETPEAMQSFDRLGYRFKKTLSSKNHYVFVKESS